MGIDHNALYAELEAMGEAEVRITLAKGLFQMGQKTNLAQEWLRGKDEERAAASSAKRDTREEETLSIAKEANEIARSASFAASAAAASASEANTISRSNSRRAWRAEIIAAIAAAAAIVAAIAAVMGG